MAKQTGVNVDRADFDVGITEGGMYRCDFVTTWVPDSLNATLAKHHFKRSQIRKAWDSLLYHCSNGQRPIQPIEKYTVQIHRFASRELDFDNLVSSFKDVIDAMVTVGIMAGDEYRRTGPWVVKQTKVPGKEARIEVTIVEQENNAGPRQTNPRRLKISKATDK